MLRITARKNITYIFFIIISIILILLASYECKDSEDEQIVFSHDSGFYSNSFELSIKHPSNTDIYYTLDSTIPTKTSNHYEEPITISDASCEENVYSMIKETSLYNMKEYVESLGWSTYLCMTNRLPSKPVDKCTVLTLAVYNKMGGLQQYITKHYFVGYDKKIGYDDIPIVSISTDPANLFDYEYGIYVLGKTFDDDMIKNGISDYWFWKPGNWSNRGEEWERDATITFYDSNHELTFYGNVGMRIQGGQSRNLAQKSLNIYNRTKDIYSFPDFFNNGIIEDNINLFSGSQDYETKVRDVMVNRAVVDDSIIVRDYIPCQLFLEGEYWGLYYITEKLDESYFANHYNVDTGNVIMAKNGQIEVGEEKDLKAFNEMINFMTTANMEERDNYDKACELVDINSLIAYYATMIYVGRYNDWYEPTTNIAMWRTRTSLDKEYCDGKWRWIIFDLNSGSQNYSAVTDDTIKSTLDQKSVFFNLCKNEEFVNDFCTYMSSMIEDDFAIAKIENLLDEYEKLLSDPMKVNNIRFFDSEESMTSGFDYSYQQGMNYSQMLESILKFYEERPEIIQKYMKSNFNWVSN